MIEYIQVMKCTNCLTEEQPVKNGIHKGHQRYKCKECGYQFTREGRNPDCKKDMAVFFWEFKLSADAIALLLEIDRATVYRWIEDNSETANAADISEVKSLIRYAMIQMGVEFKAKDEKVLKEILGERTPDEQKLFEKQTQQIAEIMDQLEHERLQKINKRNHERWLRMYAPHTVDGINEQELRKLVQQKKDEE